MNFQHKQGNYDSENPIAECLDPRGRHLTNSKKRVGRFVHNHIICNQRTRCVIPQLTLASKRESTRLGGRAAHQLPYSTPLPSPTLQFATPPSPNSSLMSPFYARRKELTFASADRGGVITRPNTSARAKASRGTGSHRRDMCKCRHGRGGELLYSSIAYAGCRTPPNESALRRKNSSSVCGC